MHRMRRFSAPAALVALVWAVGGTASADVLHPSTDPQKYPDIIANLGKGVSYTYDATTQRGDFHLMNTAYVLVTGTGTNGVFDIDPTPAGDRHQSLNVTLDKNGHFVDDPGNFYEVYGKVTADGKTYSGLLLRGKPVAFATSDLTGPNGDRSTQFQADLKLTGEGLLSSYFGPDSYMQLVAETGNEFKGQWDRDFKIAKVSSNTHGPNVDPQPFPIPEPSAVALLAVAGLGLAYRRRLRR